MTENYSINNVPPQERHAYWTDLICDVFMHFDSVFLNTPPFFGNIRTCMVGNLLLFDSQSSPQYLNRSSIQIAKDNEPAFLFSVQLKGNHGWFKQGGETCHFNAGDILFGDGMEPYEVRFPEDFQHLAVKIPSHLITERLPSVKNLPLTKIPACHPIAKMTGDYIQSFNQYADSFDTVTQYKFATNLLDLIATTLAATMQNSQRLAPSSLQTARIIAVQQFIDNHSSDPALTPERIAQANHISVSYLHKLFQKMNTTVGRYIREKRLCHCHQDLAHPHNQGRSISDIAYRHGFNDMSYFSRAFKKHFGLTPKAWQSYASQTCNPPKKAE